MGIELAGDIPADLFITGELATRTAQSPDYLQEKLALQELAGRMVHDPADVLPHFVDLAMKMTGGVSAGLSLFEKDPSPGVFRWRYLKGVLAQFEDALTPRNFSPCGVTLDMNAPVLSLHPERFYGWISDAKIVVPEVLLVPLYLGDTEPAGTLWIVSPAEKHFDAGHARVASEMASFVGIALRMLRDKRELERALEEQETLTKEMSHRVKNLFAIAEGMVRISQRTAQTKEDMGETLVGRFHALSSAHSLIRRSFGHEPDGPRVLDFASLLKTVVQPHERPDQGKPRFHIEGPAAALGERSINGMALVFHELATNSAKHGAASADAGQIAIRWTMTGDNLVVAWKEEGGPAVPDAAPAMGYGSKLLHDTIYRQFKGEMQHDWLPGGLTMTLSIPVKYLAD